MMYKHDPISQAVVEHDDKHASDEFLMCESCEKLLDPETAIWTLYLHAGERREDAMYVPVCGPCTLEA